MDGHAENAPDTLSELADSLPDTLLGEPEQEEESQTSDESTEELSTDESENDGQDESAEDPEAEEEAEPTPDRKFKVTVKGENGADEELEVDESELVKGYQRQAHYTRNMQELAKRENDAVEFLTQKHQEVIQNYTKKAEASRAAILNLANIRSAEEMAQLASTDPAAWVAEHQRQQIIANAIAQADAEIEQTRQEQAQMLQQLQQKQYAEHHQKAWAELQKQGIDREKLAKMYSDAATGYGFSSDELAAVMDHRQVAVLRDALAYRQLQAQKQSVKQSIEKAPKMPVKNTAQPRKDDQLEKRFRSGRAKLNDLASFLPDM
jgi:hypothetical protein